MVERVGRLQDRVAIVTGAGSSGPGWGNGKAATVAIVRGESGTCIPVEGDVTSPDDVERMARETIDAFGSIDVLHNNVGIHRRETMANLSIEDWDLILDTNLKSMFLTCRTVLPHMERRRKGVIVNISSIAAIRYARRSFVAYGTSNAGVLGLTRTIAVEYAGRGIRANSILPGHIDTPFVRQNIGSDPAAIEAFVKERSAWCPMGRMGDAWDVAYAALFLASDEAKFITGAELVVDGGVTSATAW
jgi:NAD(P)-dependent dehydrogenase (short-subunit alcohol dehydrogenase family)